MRPFDVPVAAREHVLLPHTRGEAVGASFRAARGLQSCKAPQQPVEPSQGEGAGGHGLKRSFKLFLVYFSPTILCAGNTERRLRRCRLPPRGRALRNKGTRAAEGCRSGASVRSRYAAGRVLPRSPSPDMAEYSCVKSTKLVLKGAKQKR